MFVVGDSLDDFPHPSSVFVSEVALILSPVGLLGLFIKPLLRLVLAVLYIKLSPDLKAEALI